jgi:HEAT repeat protein
MASVDKETSGFRNLSEDEIERLTNSLDSVAEGELGVAMLAACGKRAIPSLRRLLLQGSPKSVFIGRQRAVRALSELGAVSVLVEYVSAQKQISDPALRYSEEAVENTAARELAKWRTDGVFQTLLQVVEQRALPGAIETLGAFGRQEAIPALIQCLEDDVARPAALDALTKLRDIAVRELITAVRSPEPCSANEVPSSLLRRRAALAVLAGGKLSSSDWERLRFLMYETDPVLSVRGAGIGLSIGSQADSELATRNLLISLASPDWSVVIEAEELLLENFDVTCNAIEKELETRAMKSDLESQKLASVLRSLLRRGEAA